MPIKYLAGSRSRRKGPRSRTIVLFLLLFAQIMSPLLLTSCVTVQYTSVEPYYATEYTAENQTETYTEIVPVVRTVSHEETLQPYVVWSNPQLIFNEHKSIWYYGYDLSSFPVHNKQKIKISFFKQDFYEYLAVSVFDMDPKGQILAPPRISSSDNISAIAVQRNWITAKPDITTFTTWFGSANMKLDFAHFLGGKINLFLNSGSPSTVELDTRGAKDVAVLISGPTDPQNCRFSSTLEWSENIAENVTRTAERPVPIQIEHRVLKEKSMVLSRQVPFWEALIPRKP